MNKCPFCGGSLEAISSRITNKYAGGCTNPNCIVIFRTKELYNKLEAVMTITSCARKMEK